MRFEDDDEEPGTGPPPDPSLRSWRHPSEIASAEAAAIRYAREEPGGRSGADTRSRARSASGLALTAATAVAVTAIAILALGSGIYYLDGDTAITTSAGDVVGGSGPSGAASTSRNLLGSELRPPPLASSSTTSSLRPVSTTTINPITAGVIQGVYAVDSGEPVRLGAFTVADDMILTSASAVAGHARLAIGVTPFTVAVTLVATDDVTDVALLAMDDALGPAVLATLGAMAGHTSLQGHVVDSDRVTVNRNGQVVYGALATDTTCPRQVGGAPLVDDQGRLVGIVVDSPGSTMSAIPISEALRIGRSLRSGTSSSMSFALKGVARPGGGVELTSVAGASPAADAGLAKGDRILSVDGVAVTDWRHFRYLVRQPGPGVAVTLEIEHQGATSRVEVVLDPDRDDD